MGLGDFRVRRVNTGTVPRWRQYAKLVVGRTNLTGVLKYEVIMFFLTNMPGALGLYLRSKLYPFILGAVGGNVVFGRGITLRHPHKIRIGENVVIDDNCVLDAKGDSNQGISIGDGVFIGRNSMLYCKDGDIEVQARVNFSFNCAVFSSDRVVISEGAMVGAYCYIMSGGSYDIDSKIAFAEQDGYAKGLTMIGEGCWLGAEVVVQDGVRIGNGCVVGSGAVLREHIPEYAVVTPHQKLVMLPRGPS